MSRQLSWLSLSLMVMAVNLTLAHQHVYADEWEKFKSKYGNNFIARRDAKIGTPRLVHGQGIPLGNTRDLTDANIAELAYNFISTNKDP